MACVGCLFSVSWDNLLSPTHLWCVTRDRNGQTGPKLLYAVWYVMMVLAYMSVSNAFSLLFGSRDLKIINPSMVGKRCVIWQKILVVKEFIIKIKQLIVFLLCFFFFYFLNKPKCRFCNKFAKCLPKDFVGFPQTMSTLTRPQTL